MFPLGAFVYIGIFTTTGACLNLKEQKWAVAVEVCLGGMLTAFCVNDHHDEKQLEKIMRQVYARANKAKPSVITSRFIVSAIVDVG